MTRPNNTTLTRPLRIVVIEDEDEFCQFLCAELAQFPHVEVIGSASQIDDAYALIHKTRPDGVFMDIKIIGGDAFQILERLQNTGYGKLPSVAMITGFVEYAPLSINTFHGCILKYITKPFLKDYKTKLQDCLDAFTAVVRANRNRDILFIKSAGKLCPIEVENITYLEVAGGGKTFFIIEGSTSAVKADMTLSKALEVLPPHFVQINRDNAVNIKKMNFMNGAQVSVSNSGKERSLKISDTFADALKGEVLKMM